jgi:sugar phosphate isomerase/epimerase
LININENLKNFEAQLRGLIKLNQQYNIKAAYQNHAGTGLGSPVWDIGQLFQRIDSPWVGCQYDIRHAVVEGGTSWPLGFDYVKPYINTLDIKDFTWVKENGKWITQNVPLGEGMVDFDHYVKMVNTLPTSIPMCLHFEYPLGGAEHGDRKIALSPAAIKKAMVSDLNFMKERLKS